MPTKIHVLIAVGIALCAIQAGIQKVQASTYSLQEVPLSEPEIINPQRGYYKWRGSEAISEMAPSSTAYERFSWRDLEPTKGNYVFSSIDTQITEANKQGRKYAFRVRDIVPSDGIAIPDYLKPYSFTQSGLVIPDYNNPYYQERMAALINKLAEKYDGNPNIDYMDIILFGKFGENHLSGIDYSTAPNGIVYPTDATLRKIVDMHVDSFRSTQMAMLRGNKLAADFVTYAMTHPRLATPLAVRNDCLGLLNGVEHFRQMSTYAQWPSLKDQWKIKPILTEYCNDGGVSKAPNQVIDYHVSTLSNGNFGAPWSTLSATDKAEAIRAGKLSGYRFVLRKIMLPDVLPASGPFHISSFWSNVGVAPAYIPWITEFQLRKTGTTQVMWKGNLDIRFKCNSITDTTCLLPTKDQYTLVDTPRTYTDELNINNAVTAGTYDLAIKITNNDPYWKVLKLANRNKTSDDAYLLGQVVVGNSTGPTATTQPTATNTPTKTSTATPTKTPTKTPTTMATATPIVTVVVPTITSTPIVCVGDLNGDNTVSLVDYSMFVSNFAKVNFDPKADLNSDGKVDLFDYTTLVNNFAKSCK